MLYVTRLFLAWPIDSRLLKIVTLSASIFLLDLELQIIMIWLFKDLFVQAL